MPNTIRILSPYLVTGNPDTINVTDQYAPGQLGGSFDLNDKTYEVVQLDSGATSATPTGVVAANQVAFWKSKTNRLVTNDARVAIGGQTASGWRNQVAGIFRNAVTPGNYTCILTNGHNVPVKAATTTAAIGDNIIANTTQTPDAIVLAAGTALTVQGIGTARNAGSGTAVNVDVDIPDLA